MNSLQKRSISYRTEWVNKMSTTYIFMATDSYSTLLAYKKSLLYM